MDVKYFLYGDAVKENSHVIGTGQTVKMEIMDQEEKTWRDAEVAIFEGATEEGEPVGLLGPFGEPYDVSKYYAKIVQILPSPLDDDE